MKTRMLLAGLTLGAAVLSSGCKSRSCRQSYCPPVVVGSAPVARPCPAPCPCGPGVAAPVAVPVPAGPPVAAQPPLAVSGYAPVAPCPNGNCGR